MNKIIQIPVKAVIPDRADILKFQGIPEDRMISSKISEIISKSINIFKEIVSPVSIISEISEETFRDKFLSAKRPGSENPVVEDIFRKASHLALFIFTAGKKVSDMIKDCFNSNDFALGSMLDSVASAGAEKGSQFGEKYFNSFLSDREKKQNCFSVLLYSPGYCGWDIKAQEKLFEYLNPENIGIFLNESFLMDPVKSISGLLVAGERSIHNFPNNYRYCKECSLKNCRERMKQIQ